IAELELSPGFDDPAPARSANEPLVGLPFTLIAILGAGSNVTLSLRRSRVPTLFGARSGSGMLLEPSLPIRSCPPARCGARSATAGLCPIGDRDHSLSATW